MGTPLGPGWRRHRAGGAAAKGGPGAPGALGSPRTPSQPSPPPPGAAPSPREWRGALPAPPRVGGPAVRSVPPARDRAAPSRLHFGGPGIGGRGEPEPPARTGSNNPGITAALSRAGERGNKVPAPPEPRPRRSPCRDFRALLSPWAVSRCGVPPSPKPRAGHGRGRAFQSHRQLRPPPAGPPVAAGAGLGKCPGTAPPARPGPRTACTGPGAPGTRGDSAGARPRHPRQRPPGPPRHSRRAGRGTGAAGMGREPRWTGVTTERVGTRTRYTAPGAAAGRDRGA